MNRPTLIATGIVIILFMVGIWVYLLAHGAPKQTSEVFTNLGLFEPAEEIRTIEPVAVTDETLVSLGLDGSTLQQLTTRAVAGFSFSQENTVRYVERGTGYIFEIDLTEGTERQISPITVPQAATAVFSPGNDIVVITSYEGYQSLSTVLQAENEDAQVTSIATLPPDARNISFHDNETLYYTLNDEGTIGYAYNIETLSRSELFTIPLIDPVIYWGNAVDGIIAHTKPSSGTQGYVYEIRSGTLTPLFKGANGLTAFRDAIATVISYIEDATYHSTVLWLDEQYEQALTMIPEKCVVDMVFYGIWCAAPLETIPDTYITDWYKGTITSNDSLWFSQLETGEGTLMANLTELSGRTIDVASIKISAGSDLLLFTNKTDGALWLYRVP